MGKSLDEFSAVLSPVARSKHSSAPSPISFCLGGHNRPALGGPMRLGSFARFGDGSFSNFSSLLREGQATLASASCSSLSLTWRLCECPYQMWLCISGIFPLHRRRLDPRAGLPEYCLRSSSPRWLSYTLQPRALKTVRVRHLVLTLHSVLRHFTYCQREGWHEYTV